MGCNEWSYRAWVSSVDRAPDRGSGCHVFDSRTNTAGKNLLQGGPREAGQSVVGCQRKRVGVLSGTGRRRQHVRMPCSAWIPLSPGADWGGSQRPRLSGKARRRTVHKRIHVLRRRSAAVSRSDDDARHLMLRFFAGTTRPAYCRCGSGPTLSIACSSGGWRPCCRRRCGTAGSICGW